MIGGLSVAAAVIDGVRGTWRVDPDQLDQSFAGRAALLSPIDRLVGKLDATSDQSAGVRTARGAGP